MLEKAFQYPELISLNMDAEQFSNSSLPFNKLLLKEMIHHVVDRAEFWQKVRSRMPEGGRALVVTRPRLCPFPLFDSACEKFSDGQPGSSLLQSEIEESGLKSALSCASWPIEVAKEDWFRLIRSRFTSNLFSYTDKEIEHGIEELRRRFSGREITFQDQLIFIEVTNVPKSDVD